METTTERKRYGIDVSTFQDPAHPAGTSWDEIGQTSSFAIARLSYGARKDARGPLHVRAARLQAMQVGGYMFPVWNEPLLPQLECFAAAWVDAGLGVGDIAPAIDIEDNGKLVITPALEPLVKDACDWLFGTFGMVMPYITQRDWHRLGEPAWMLQLPLWVANYTNAPKPATPGNVEARIWQYRVGPYGQLKPFVAKEAYLPNALDHDVAPKALPTAALSPPHPGYVEPNGPPEPSQSEIWRQRLAAATVKAFGEIDFHAGPPDPEDDNVA